MMIRKLKTLGLALMAVLALSAMASAASAQAANGTLTSTGNVTLTGTEIAGKTNVFLSAFGLSIECPGSTYDGHKVGSTTAFLPNDSGEATITPTYNQPNCKTAVGPSTVDMNGCDYVIHLGETSGTEHTYKFTTDIICEPGKDITVTSWFSAAEHTEGKEACTLHIAPQSGLAGGTVRDTTEGDLELAGTVGPIKVVETKDGLHPLLCPAKEGNGERKFGITIRGDNEAGSNTAISLSHL